MLGSSAALLPFIVGAMLYKSLISTCLCKVASLVALVVAVQARDVSIQNPFTVDLFPERFVAGTSSLVSWIPTAEGTVSLELFAGVARNRRYVSTIAHFIDNKGSFAWTPSIALEAGDDYTLQIVSDVNDQLIDCSPHFVIVRPDIIRKDIASSAFSNFVPFPATTTLNLASPVSETSSALSIAVSTSFSSLSSSPVASLPINTQTAAATTYAPVNPATSTQTAIPPSSSSGLSTGAAIGIGVGATLAVLLTIALVGFVLIRRRRQKRQQATAPDTSDPGHPELETSKPGVEKEMADLEPSGAAGEAVKKDQDAGGLERPPMAELSSPPPLSPNEYAELQRRRRAVELQAQSMGSMTVAELQGQAHPRAELEALRANARNVHELGGHAVLSEVQPAYLR